MGGVAKKFNPLDTDNWKNMATGGLIGGGLLGASGKGEKGPSAPDFAAAAEAQANSARINQSNPFGSTSWAQGPDGRWTQTTQLAGGLGQGAENLMGQIGAQGPVGTGDQARQQAIDAAYGQAASRLDPQWAQREEQTQARLANQGLGIGSEAYQTEMGNFGRDRNDAYSSAMANAIGQGTAAGHVAFADNLAAQNAPYQQLASLQGLTSGLTGQSNPTQYLNAANLGYQGELDKYGIEQGGKNSMMQGGANLAALAMMSGSDERLKINVERYAEEALPGVPFASWEWKADPGERHYGVIAQDMERVRPDLVHYAPNGMRMVDYSFLAK